MNADIQQRVVECLALAQNQDIAAIVWTEMPVWSERASALLARLNQDKDQGESAHRNNVCGVTMCVLCM